jgi:hypothetical protein
MAIWLRITDLFGLPDDQEPNNLMQMALGPALRAACANIVEAPLPPEIRRALRRLKRCDQRVDTARSWQRSIATSIMPTSPSRLLHKSVNPPMAHRPLHSSDTAAA